MEDTVRELERRVRLLEDFQMMLMESLAKVTYVEPDKPREPMLRFADGTEWDPGSGRGLYMYGPLGWFPVAAQNSYRGIVVTLTDDESVSLNDTIGRSSGGLNGIMSLSVGSAEAAGIVVLRGAVDNVAEIADMAGNIAQADVDNNLCVIAAGAGEYTLKNRLGATRQFVLSYVGF